MGLNFSRIFSVFLKYHFRTKISGYNRETVSSIIRKILECNIKFYYKNIVEIRNFSLIFEN